MSPKPIIPRPILRFFLARSVTWGTGKSNLSITLSISRTAVLVTNRNLAQSTFLFFTRIARLIDPRLQLSYGCNLGSINLATLVKNKKVDWARLQLSYGCKYCSPQG